MLNAKQCVVYFSPEKVFRDSPYNAGVDAALQTFVERGARVVDASVMSDGERYAAYLDAVTRPATRDKHGVRTLFGSHSSPGSQFGLGVPALLVLDEQGNAQAIYPHRESGRVVTIADALGG